MRTRELTVLQKHSLGKKFRSHRHPRVIRAQSLHLRPEHRPNHPQRPFEWMRYFPARQQQQLREAVSPRYGHWTKLHLSRPAPCSACRPALPGTRCVFRFRQSGREGCKTAGYKHDCVVLSQNLRQLRTLGISAELVLRSLEVLQGILQTGDF